MNLLEVKENYPLCYIYFGWDISTFYWHYKSTQNSPWKSIEKAIGKFKGESSIEDVLRRQIEKGVYYDSGGGGVKPPGGGNSGGGPDGSGESEEESLAGMWEENIQVILATLGFIFLVLSLSLSVSLSLYWCVMCAQQKLMIFINSTLKHFFF